MRLTVLILFIVIGGNSVAQSRLEQAVLDLSKRKFDWLINKQYDSLNALLDDKLEYVHSNGWVQTKADVINDTRSGSMVYQSVDIKEANARAYNNDAVIVTGTGTFSGIHGQPFTILLHYTEVYIKLGNRWKLASRHSNRMP
ncbi:MAG TPA: nuclear transport factor 2 family protein [Cyclobacteriaceae bacterium]|nr:nuclear transport factor 2 family protein [Cyclobacteriaceae bacterium]